MKRFSMSLHYSKEEVDDVFDQGNELTNMGYAYMDQGKFDLANQSFQKALTLAKSIEAKGDIHNALRVLARLSSQANDPDSANEYATQALRESGTRSDQLYPRLIQAEVAAHRGDVMTAEKTFREIERDPTCPCF